MRAHKRKVNYSVVKGRKTWESSYWHLKGSPANISSGNHHPPRLNHVQIGGITPSPSSLGLPQAHLPPAKINRALIPEFWGFKRSALLPKAKTCRKCEVGGKFIYRKKEGQGKRVEIWKGCSTNTSLASSVSEAIWFLGHVSSQWPPLPAQYTITNLLSGVRYALGNPSFPLKLACWDERFRGERTPQCFP